jgi:hypothetical protein
VSADAKAEKAETKENLAYFLGQCIRQGIELKHDPEKKKVEVEKGHFSAVATMMKIRERTLINEEARRGREKRRNKMAVDQQL